MMRSGGFRGTTRLILLLVGVLFGCGGLRPHTSSLVQGWRPRFHRGRKHDDAKGTTVTATSTSEETCPVDPFKDIQPESPSSPKDADVFEKFYSRLPPNVQLFLKQVRAVLMHEPPVGIVAAIVVFRLFWTGRIFQVYKQDVQSAEGVLSIEEKKTPRRRRQRMKLDKEDRAYSSYGGVERILRKLCWSALNGFIQTDESTPPQVYAAVDALSVNFKPGSSLYSFVEDMIDPLSRLEQVLIDDSNPKPTKSSVQLRDMWNSPKTQEEVVLQVAAKTAEIRTLDALIRLSRDHLLTTSSRLRRNLKHWNRRVVINSKVGRVFNRLMSASVEGDRMRLSFARAAYQAEVTRLGSLQRVLSERPDDVSDNAILDSLSISNKLNATQPEESVKYKGKQNETKKKRWKFRPLAKALPHVSKYSIRFNAEGRGRLTLRVYEGETVIRSDVSRDILLKSDYFNPQEWLEEAHDWTEDARRVLCTVLKETIEKSISDKTQDMKDLMVINKWCTYDCGTCDDLAKQWQAILDLADGLEDQRRVGEGREISLIGSSGLRYWTSRLDIFGIPSALATVGVAKVVHNVLLPYWPKFKLAAREALNVGWKIFKNRFWEPFYGIVQGLLTDNSGVLEAFDVDNEEKSLDNMLEDLGFGDGTEATRKEALQSASRLYEDQLAKGALRSAIGGKLVRLLLVQVQQLKAGLLHALSSIDVLVAANRLNIQIMAAIPAVLIVYFGSRVVIRSIFTIKVKKFRSVRDVHAEMAQYLDDMEMAFLLAAPAVIKDETHGKQVTTIAADLSDTDLGQFVLRAYSYLVLLDYCSALFPHRATAAIHTAFQQLAAAHNLGVDRQVALLRLIKQKHMDLLKYL